MAEELKEAAREWVGELGWLFDDEKLKPNSVAQMHPDVIKDGVRLMNQLLEECKRLESEIEKNKTD